MTVRVPALGRKLCSGLGMWQRHGLSAHGAQTAGGIDQVTTKMNTKGSTGGRGLVQEIRNVCSELDERGHRIILLADWGWGRVAACKNHCGGDGACKLMELKEARGGQWNPRLGRVSD